MSAIGDLIRLADERLQANVEVAAGLTEATAEAGLDQVDDPDQALEAARTLLADRSEALAVAQRRVQQLDDMVARLSRALPFLEDGWPRQREVLRAAFREDPEVGLASWLNYWFEAASCRRLDALRRLRADVQLPGDVTLIGDRLYVAARALDEDDWLPCHDVLLLGAAGVRVGNRQVPGEAVREDLRLLAARLALHNELPDRADAILKGPDTASRLALHSWAARLRGDEGNAESLLAQARALHPYDLDVTVESIIRARQQDVYGALDIARATVAALPSLGDVDGDMGRLVGSPPEIWVALAERARDDDEHAAARRFLDRAAAAAARDDYVVLAAAEEVRAAVAAPGAKQRRAFLLAGYWSARAGRLDRARRNYEAAAGDGIPADQADAQIQAAARLRLADVIAVTAWQQPRHAVADELQYALALVAQARPMAGWIGAESWSYLTEADLRIQRSRVPGLPSEERREQEWAALLAAARAVSDQPGWAMAWLGLAEAAMTRDLYLVSEAAAKRAYEIEQAESTRAGYVRALINTGGYEEALALLGDADDPWRQCVRGLVALRQGRADEAIRHFTGLRIDPSWLWAWNASIRVLVIMGDAAAARLRSAELMRAGADRVGERSWLAVAAFDARLNGDLKTARERAEGLAEAAGRGDFRTLYALGEAKVLDGHQDGWEVLASAVDADPRPTANDVWEREEFPVLRALAAARGISLTPRALEPRERASDAVTELSQAAEAAEAALVPEAKEAARFTKDVLSEPAVADGGDEHDARTPRHVPAPQAPVVRLQVPTSWVTDPRLRDFMAWARKWMAVEETGDLEPDGYRLLAGTEVRASGHTVLAPQPAGEHDLKALATWTDAEVIAAVCYQQILPMGPLPLTVRLLAHLCWELRGRLDWSEKLDWGAAERVLGQFIAEDAYFRWEKRGRPLFAYPLADWLAAVHAVTETGIVPGAVANDQLRFQTAMQGAYLSWERRGRPFGNPLADWPG